ncbi:MAG: hypothetical protein Q4E57_05225 [Eubacteriales bacterium]|nr:hypothetical protein [Eubacteriales bacterium]
MKFIHLSDIRIGSSSESGTPWENARQTELEGALSRVMDEAVSFDADLVIITGGLFSHVPTTIELDELNGLLSGFPMIDIVIIAGETDQIKKSSPIQSYSWAGNIHYVMSGQPERFVLKNISTEITAASVAAYEQASPQAISEVACRPHPDSQPIKLAVLRWAEDEDVKNSFYGTNISYVAVGSSTPGNRTIAANAHCPGFFEPEAMGDNGSHGMLEGVISESTGLLEKIEFKPMASASYVPLLIKTNAKTTAGELEELVEREIMKRGETNIYRLKITGTRNPEESFDLSKVKAVYRISEILDETEPEYDFRELFAEHPQDMIGFYISRILNNKHEMSPVEKKAMFYGLDALLHTSVKNEE